MRDLSAEFIGQIYEAAFVPELWSSVLTELERIFTTQSSAMLLFEADRPVQLRGTGPAEAAVQLMLQDEHWRQNRRFGHVLRNPLTGWVLAEQYFPPDVLSNDKPYNYLQDQGLTSQAGTVIPLPTGEMLAMITNRHNGASFSDADLDALNVLHPHLARGAVMAARLGLERARASMVTLGTLGLPAAVATQSGRIIDANDRFIALGEVFGAAAFGRVAIHGNPAATRLLQDALEQIHSWSGEVVRSIPLPPHPIEGRLILHVLPLVGAARDLFSQGLAVLAVTAVKESQLVPSASLLTGLFDLTPAETRLVVALASGQNVGDFAAEQGVSITTARSHLARVFQKTGTSQQSQLVALVKSTAILG